MNKIELGYYNEDTRDFHYNGGSYVTCEEAMKAADNAGDWFETCIGDHRAIDIIMSLADEYEIYADDFEDMGDLVDEIERQHKLAPVKEEILAAGYRIDVDKKMEIVKGTICLDKNRNISDDHYHDIVVCVCFDYDEAMDENEEFSEELIVNKKCNDVLDILASMIYEERNKEEA